MVPSVGLFVKRDSYFQYTCFDVSPSFLVFGATSGGLYLFRREPCTFLQLLPNKVGLLLIYLLMKVVHGAVNII